MQGGLPQILPKLCSSSPYGKLAHPSGNWDHWVVLMSLWHGASWVPIGALMEEEEGEAFLPPQPVPWGSPNTSLLHQVCLGMPRDPGAPGAGCPPTPSLLCCPSQGTQP